MVVTSFSIRSCPAFFLSDLLPQHQSDCDVWQAEEDNITEFCKGYSAIIDQHKFMLGDLEELRMKLVSPPAAADQKEKEPKQDQSEIQDEASDEYLRRNLKKISQIPLSIHFMPSYLFLPEKMQSRNKDRDRISLSSGSAVIRFTLITFSYFLRYFFIFPRYY
jgi:hypothetical protein